MAPNGFKVLDSDMHILEPADLWQRYLDPKFKNLAPRGTTDHVRDLRLVGPDGRAWGRPVDPPSGTVPLLAVGSFCGGGVLERHPKLRVAFLEGNCGWLPFLLWRLDEHWEMFGDRWAPELKNAPSSYFKRQCYASIEADEEPAKYAIDFLGNDRLVFSTDFPHVDTKYPKAVQRFLNLPIGEEDKRKIPWDNCAAYYGMVGT